MKKYRNKNAFGILQAMLGLFLVTLAISGIILVISRAGSNKEIATIRTKIMRIAQAAKLLLSKPESYVCNQSPQVPVGSPPGTPPTAHWTCTVDTNVIDRLQLAMPQANCPVGQFCGIKVSATPRSAPVLVVPPDAEKVPKVDLSVSYTGKLLGISFAANIINENIPNIKVPPEAYVGRTGVCGIDKDGDGDTDSDDGYLYKGVKTNGQDDCRGFPSCDIGKLFIGFNPDGSARCSNLNGGLSKDGPSDKHAIKCADDKYMSEFKFDPSNGNSLISSCKARLDPCGVGNACPQTKE